MMLAPMPIAREVRRRARSRIMSTAVDQMSTLTMLRSTAPIVSARSARRTLGTGDVSSSDEPVLVADRRDPVAGLLLLQLPHDRRTRQAGDPHQEVRDEDDHEDAERHREVVADLGRALRCR